MIRAMAIWSSSRLNNIGFQSDADADTPWIGTDFTENTVLNKYCVPEIDNGGIGPIALTGLIGKIGRGVACCASRQA